MFRIYNSSFWPKAIATLLIELLLLECFYPTVAFGLTSGPSQPEFSTFTPAGVSNMVNPFTGDFNYNIDLLSVPGFENGYPLNLSYNAGVTMEQEASWVGLGWSLNTGSVTRNLRGLPDDFKGDLVEKEKNLKPSRTVSLGLSIPPSEAVGFDLSKLFQQGSVKGYYNNYTGPGYQVGADFSVFNFENQKGRFNSGISLTYDSQSGFGLKPNVSYGHRLKKSGTSFLGAGLSLGFSSREGMNDISFQPTYSKVSGQYNSDKEGNYTGTSSTDGAVSYDAENNQYTAGGEPINPVFSKHAAGVSFAASAPVSTVDFPRKGNSFSVRLKGGGAIFGFTLDADVDLYYSSSSISQNNLKLPAYGYFYSDKAGNSNALMDFHREKDVQATKTSKTLSVTVADNDIFNVSAQGLGGMVRAYRSDVGFYSDPEFTSNSLHIGAGVEFDADAAPGTKFGINSISVQPSSSYSGDWKDDKGSLASTFFFEGKDASNQVKSNGFYEPVYFKSAAEITPDFNSSYGANKIYSNDAHRVDIRKKGTINGAIPIVRNDLSNQDGASSNLNNYTNKRSSRIKRVTNYQFLTRKEAGLSSSASKKEYHIGKIIAVQPGGKRFEFGEPLYNTVQKEVAFSSGHTYLGNEGGEISYSGTESSVNNKSGIDRLYQYTKMPPYAHSFLITSIKSMDYVDVSSDGTTPDDFGEYIKFSYSSPSNYSWRAPYKSNKANYAPGNLSSKDDDKGSFTYGQKEIKFVQEIETKTHLVKFFTSNRKDALQVNGEHGGANTSTTGRKQRLDKITLYKKPQGYTGGSSSLIPIKSVHFDYSYNLCKGIPNKSTDNTQGGKLTLKKVWFSYAGNESSNAKLADYQFDYHENVTAENPNYDGTKIDRWGNYQPKRFDGANSNIKSFPYTFQNYTQTERENIAGAWCLKQIKMPSGGEIDVSYEMDDYQYVQNKKAMMMAQIAGFSDNSNYTTMSNKLTNKTKYVFVKIPGNVPAAEVPKYFNGVDKLYFKVFTALKQVTNALKYTGLNTVDNGMAYDYVEGYADVDGTYGFSQSNPGYTLAYVKIKRVDLNDSGAGSTCPIRLAGFQHLKMNRTDLLNNTVNIPDAGNPMAILAPIMSIVGILKDAASLIAGFNTIASISYCKSAKLTDTKHPSYIRINTPGVKYGGGHRVKRITINDNWSKLSSATGSQSFTYGQEFIYRLSDGNSAGVAAYEPMIGGEENPFKRPIFYGPNKMFFARNDAFYVEEPLGESFFPAPVVGYSKVITKSISHDNVTRGKSGVTVNEYYTAKDFPTIIKRTGIQSKRNSPRMIFIPLLGMKTMNNDGYSQGVSVQLNNMHGKEKSASTYRYLDIRHDEEFTNHSKFLTDLQKLDNELPTARSESHYHLKDGAEYNPNGINEVRATVDVLQENGSIQKKEMGKQVEFYGSLRENYTESISTTFQPNAHQWWIVVVPMVVPFLGKSVGMYREATTTKVITRNGVLKKTIAYDGYAKVTTDNMIYDNETGEVRLAKSNNSYGDPVYSYNIPGYRYYPEFKGTYENIGAQIDGGGINVNNVDAFRKGDMVHYYSSGLSGTFQELWVDNISGTTVTFKNASGTPVTVSSGVLKVIRSGNYNLQPYGVGKIIALENPLDLVNGTPCVQNPLGVYIDITQFNAFALSGAFNGGGTVNAGLVFHGSGATWLSSYDLEVEVTPSGGGSGWYKWKLIPTGGGTTLTALRVGITPTSLTGWENATVAFTGTGLIPGQPISLSYNGETVNSVIREAYGELKGACVQSKAKVLHSEARVYSDQFVIEYEDFLKTQMSASAYTTLKTKIDNNPYRFGKRGVFRVKTPYFYRTKREQKEIGSVYGKTDMQHDGVYEKFDWYGFVSGAVNLGWIPKGEATMFSPYGQQLESKDAKGIYSSALYGYENLLPVAVAGNAKYKEIAFEGYEDYRNTTYPDAGFIGHGHLRASASSGYSIQSAEAHTGRFALRVNSSINYPLETGMDLQTGEEYLVSVWVKKTSSSSITASVTGGYSTSYDNTKTNIEGWQQLSFKFTKGATNPILILSGSNFFVDDLRVFPSDGSFMSYVYDKDRLRLLATLDAQNYATIYNYDNEGRLAQVKKETERGIMTLKSGRMTTKKQLNP